MPPGGRQLAAGGPHAARRLATSGLAENVKLIKHAKNSWTFSA